uniref:Uncharacterized protein n=1 Tax=Haptolina brevifila TaxID=156173 RepID=A0A7S2E190_9EUKA|mmetsp:Transcript_47005/g.93654  ORF Transcript_47005/g.93654 Transcript_47005/m.93654 type:complete len:166 (+) Transcript_47005:1-498(+)
MSTKAVDVFNDLETHEKVVELLKHMHAAGLLDFDDSGDDRREGDRQWELESLTSSDPQFTTEPPDLGTSLKPSCWCRRYAVDNMLYGIMNSCEDWIDSSRKSYGPDMGSEEERFFWPGGPGPSMDACSELLLLVTSLRQNFNNGRWVSPAVRITTSDTVFHWQVV